jgi:hypothetical protein
MADFNVDVNLPSAINVDITSPTQALATNVSIPGPQGPRGEKGNPTSINSLTAENIVITGVNGNTVYATGLNTIFISGNSGYFQSAINNLTTNLNSTGNTLNIKIDNLSGYVNSQDTNISNNLISTGSSLQSNINTLSSNLNSTGSNLENKITSLSGDAVLEYGNQTIQGQKTFTEDLIVQKSGFFWSGIKIGLNSIIINEESIKISGDPVVVQSTFTGYTGDVSNTYATINNLVSTGSTLETKIGSLSGTLTSNYATITNLASTGATLTSSINSLNSAFTGFTGNLDTTYATDSQLATTGTTLVNSISSLSGTLTSNYATITNLASTGLTLVNTISSLSGTLTSTYATVTNLASTGSTLDAKINSLSGYVTGADATLITNLASTGSTLNSSINSLSGLFTGYTGTLDATFASDTQLASTGSTLQTNINNLSGVSVLTFGNQTISGVKTFDLFPIVSGNKLITGVDLSSYATITNLASTGSTLNNSISSLSGTLTSTYATINNLASTGSTLATNLASTGLNLDTKINTLSGSSVLLYGDQSVGGVKTFRDNVYINNLFVTGAETIVSTNNFNVQSPYVLLNLTGGAVDGGIFFVTGAGLTGINNSGPIIGFDHSNKFKFGVSTRNSDLSTLPDIASVQDITAYSGFVDGKYSTIINLALTGSTLSTNLASTGSTLQTNINNLSNTYATITNLGLTGSTLVTNLASTGSTLATNLTNTGSTLQTNINNLSGYINSSSSNIVFTTGNQTISGTKTFANNLEVQGTGIFNALDLSNISDFSFSGVTINLINSTVQSSGQIYISGNPVLTGVNLSSYATITNLASTGSTLSTNLASTGSTLQTNINDLSNTYATITNLASTGSTLVTNLASTGSTLNTKINNLSGYFNSTGSNIVFTTGNQTISGDKIFKNNIVIEQTGIFSAIDLSDTDSILLSGIDIQIVSGSMTLTNPPTISGNPFITGNLALYATTINLASTGNTLNSNINSLSGTLTSNYATITNLASTGSTLNSNINSLSGTLTGNYLTTSSASSTYATITNLASTGSTLNTRINNLSGYINSTSSNIVFTTGNQTISGTKTFIQDATFGDTGQGDFLVISGNNFTVYGSGNFTSGLFVNGNAVLTGVNLSPYATTVNLASTGSTLDTKINNLSGVSVLRFGDQTISGVKTFIGNHNISGNLNITGNIRVSENDILIAPANYIYITGNQTSIVNGTKYLADTTARSFGFNLPASPSTGNYLEFADPFYTWSGNNFILSGNGNNIETENAPFTGDLEGQSIKTIFVGGNYGWRIV